MSEFSMTRQRAAASAVPSLPLPPRQSSRRAEWKIPLHVLGSLIVLAGLGVAAGAAPLLAPHDPIAPNLLARNLPPFWMAGGSLQHPLGTDQVGYDLLSRTLYGARPALFIGLCAAAIGLVLGTVAGVLAGYYRGFVDHAIMMLADAQLSSPFLVIAIAVVAVLGQSVAVLLLLAGLSAWPAIARAVRAQVVSLRGREFVVASRALGARDWWILWCHLLPNLLWLVIVMVTIQLRGLILFEAFLSFLGLGVPPPEPSWGSMIASGRQYLVTAWWIAVIPGIALVLTVVSVSLIGDWLRDVLDPTLRGR
jgi:peptide/nickel transport system permease protein